VRIGGRFGPVARAGRLQWRLSEDLLKAAARSRPAAAPRPCTLTFW
jgi:hypothetical protein